MKINKGHFFHQMWKSVLLLTFLKKLVIPDLMVYLLNFLCVKNNA